MNVDLAQKAISLALNGNWNEAVKINNQILKEDPENIDALNRIARAYAEQGKMKLAKGAANKVLSLDQFNSIATKSLAKWKSGKSTKQTTPFKSNPRTFIEEPGKTKVVSLLHLGSEDVVDSLASGQEVCMHTQGHRVSICSQDGKYIGRLSDVLSTHLKNLVSCGNEYKTYIKSISEKEVSVFIKEIKRDDSVSDIPSFSGEKFDYVSFTPPELVRGKEPVLTLDEEDEE